MRHPTHGVVEDARIDYWSVMTNDPLRENAIRRRDAALSEARRWDDFIRMLDELRGVCGPGISPHSVDLFVRGSDGAPPQTGGGSRITNTEQAVIKIIEREGRPVPTRELLPALAALGVDVGGKEPSSTLSARLSRSNLVENVRPYGWRLKEPRQTDGATDTSPDAAMSVTPTTDRHREGDAGGGT